jgi:hypothetical protein
LVTILRLSGAKLSIDPAELVGSESGNVSPYLILIPPKRLFTGPSGIISEQHEIPPIFFT